MQKTISLSRSYLNIPSVSSGYRYQKKYGTHSVSAVKKGGFLLAMLIAAFAICAIAFYIIQINLAVQQNYQVRDLENRLSALQNENQRLSVDSLTLENSQVLADEAKYLGMEPSGQVSYVRISAPILVRK
jgi:cell division protein FtsL